MIRMPVWTDKSHRATAAMAVAIAVCVLGYTGVRAWKMPIVCDEAGTYLEQVSRSPWGILAYEYPVANHHLLNSLLMKLWNALLGSAPFFLRCHTLIAHVVFVFVSLAVMWRVQGVATRLLIFCMLNLNPYVLDFFGLARGYGMGMTCVLLSCFCLVRYCESNRKRDLWGSLASGAIAVLCNFAILNYFVALVGVLIVKACGEVLAREPDRDEKGRRGVAWVQGVAPPLAAGGILGGIVALPIYRIMHGPAADAVDAGTRGFWGDTVWQLAVETLHRVPYGMMQKYVVAGLAMAGVGIVVAGAGVACQTLRRRRWWGLSDPLVLLVLCIVGVVFSVVFQFHFCGVGYPYRRSALFYLPIIGWIAIEVLRRIEDRLNGIFLACASVLAIAGMGQHVVRAANVTYVPDYAFDAMTVRMLSDLRQVDEAKDGGGVRLGVSELFVPTIRFYTATGRAAHIRSLGVVGKTTECDYYYLLTELDAHVAKGGPIVREYPSVKAILVRSDSDTSR